MSDPVSLYGTSQQPAPLERLSHGDVAVTLQDGALRHLAVRGTEIIRSVAFLARAKVIRIIKWVAIFENSDPKENAQKSILMASKWTHHFKRLFNTHLSRLLTSKTDFWTPTWGL